MVNCEDCKYSNWDFSVILERVKHVVKENMGGI